MLARAVDNFEPDQREHNADAAHHDKHVLPAEGVNDPAHQRSKNHRGEVLRRIEDRRRGAAFGGGKPRGDNTGITGKGRRFRQAHQKTQHKQRHHGGGDAEFPDIALQHGEQRPGEDAQGIDFFRAETVEQPAAGDLSGHVGPAKGRKNKTQGNGVDTEVFLQA